ncbi:MAG: hypothetical protein L0H15_10865 [Nitrosospira sp.]|nr:hypothetical protein [Nitrosospira sp.]
MARTQNPLWTDVTQDSLTPGSNHSDILTLFELILLSSVIFQTKQRKDFSADRQDKELLDAITRVKAQALEMKGTLSIIKQHTCLTEDEDYIVKTMSGLLPKLPELIAAKRTEKINTDIKRYLELMGPQDPLRNVTLAIEDDNIKMQMAFIKEHSCMDSKGINSLSGQSPVNPAQTASRWKGNGQIFSVDYFGTDLFPAFQFEAGRPKMVIKKILAILSPYRSPWQIAYWFVDENVWLDNAQPVDLMESRETDVLQAARMEIEPSAY